MLLECNGSFNLVDVLQISLIPSKIAGTGVVPIGQHADDQPIHSLTSAPEI